eukprot:TRINITY_DN110872_c0_g1_i1.p1 TRINITY_DN110872_c0_g1~~TRINITY_DN110872_c0_g1_i1.p1  ORF type:complete len:294 (-),score=67.02 TRINITY_DN110872_c0_g1_i1:197-1078(-)
MWNMMGGGGGSGGFNPMMAMMGMMQGGNKRTANNAWGGDSWGGDSWDGNWGGDSSSSSSDGSFAWGQDGNPQNALQYMLNKRQKTNTGGLKTKICAKWEAGECGYGTRCHFAHGEHELNTAKPEWKSTNQRMEEAVEEAFAVPEIQEKVMSMVAKALGAAVGKNMGRQAVRETREVNKVKTKLCKNYQEEGTCSFGEWCAFAHGEEDLGNPCQLAPKSRTPTFNGSKTKICQFWLEGKCSRDPCTFAHGGHEIGMFADTSASAASSSAGPASSSAEPASSSAGSSGADAVSQQ